MRATARFRFTSTRVGIRRTLNRFASSGRSSTSTRVTRRRLRSLRARCARRLSIRLAGPDRNPEKKTRRLRPSRPDPGRFIPSLVPRVPARETRRNYTDPMGAWYWIGVFAGFGVALGIAAAALFAGRRTSVLAPFLAAAIGIALGIVFAGAGEAAAGGVGGILGAAGSLEVV